MELEDRYLELRGLAFGIAYRMLGTASDAEDVVQDAFLRLQRVHASTTEVRDPEAYLVTVTTRVAIDRRRAVQARRESYVGTWLPEPLLTDPSPDPAEPALRAEALSTVVLLLLESLSPVERAVFVLREAFRFDYGEIATVVEKSEANCRQIFVRANRRVTDGRPRFEASEDERRRFARELLVACEGGDLDGLVDLFAEDVAFHADGGGKVRAFPRSVVGPVRTARLVLSQFRHATAQGLSVRAVGLNHQPGFLVTLPDGRPASAVAFDTDDRVRTIHSVLNPEKLTAVGPPPSGPA